VGEALSIAVLIWQAFFAYFFGRLQKSMSPYGLSTMLGIIDNLKYSKENGLIHIVIRPGHNLLLIRNVIAVISI